MNGRGGVPGGYWPFGETPCHAVLMPWPKDLTKYARSHYVDVCRGIHGFEPGASKTVGSSRYFAAIARDAGFV